MNEANTSLRLDPDLKKDIQVLALMHNTTLTAITKGLYKLLLSGKVEVKQLDLSE